MSTTGMTFAQFVAQFSWLFNGIIGLLASVALLIFMWGLAQFLINFSGSAEYAKRGKDFMIWGIIALFVIFAIGGILNFFAYDFFGTTVYQGGTVPSATGDCIPTANGIGCAL